jgi:undecaprenyl-diphosphatase
MLEILILSIIQGITEFLPISSSSHLILISELLNFKSQGLSIDVSLHIGSFLAIIFYFKNDLFNFIKNKDLFIKIFTASIPTLIIGYVLIRFNLIDQLRSLRVIGWTTISFGLLLYFADKFKNKKKIKDFNYNSALFIGLFQVLSLMPGVSRSGISITAARFLKFKRVDSAKISFLLSVPTLSAISFYGLYSLVNEKSLEFSFLNLLSIFLSFIFSLITITFFIKYIKKFSLKIFVIYRILFGIILLSLAYL